MANLRINESGGIWCPKTNSDIDPSPSNLGGCSHCVFCMSVEGEGRGAAVSCSLVPAFSFCGRISIYSDNTWSCKTPPTLSEYRGITGDLVAEEVPADFVIPRPTTFTRCLLCASQGRRDFIPNPAQPLSKVCEALEILSSPESRAKYPPPATPGAKSMRGILSQLNPAWKKRHGELEALLPPDADTPSPKEEIPTAAGPSEVAPPPADPGSKTITGEALLE